MKSLSLSVLSHPIPDRKGQLYYYSLLLHEILSWKGIPKIRKYLRGLWRSPSLSRIRQNRSLRAVPDLNLPPCVGLLWSNLHDHTEYTMIGPAWYAAESGKMFVGCARKKPNTAAEKGWKCRESLQTKAYKQEKPSSCLHEMRNPRNWMLDLSVFIFVWCWTNH